MKVEIERKFLLASESWRTRVLRSERIRDGLLSSNEDRKVRVRLIGSRATLTVKTSRIQGARQEFEYDIPSADAEKLIENCGSNVIEKIRHYVEHGSLTWEIDDYEGLLKGVILAEVELESLHQQVELPDWVGAEVTAEPPYRKINLLRARQGQVKDGS